MEPDGRVETDPRRLRRVVQDAVDQACLGLTEPVAAVGIAAFWHSLMGVDARGEPVTPLLPWSDLRATAQTDRLRESVNERAMHRRTGCRLHTSYWPARLRWFHENDREVFRRVARWVSFTEWLGQQWLGRQAVSLSQASATGLLHQDTCRWDDEVLDICRIDERRLSPLVDVDADGTLLPRMRQRWPALAAARWIPAVGDGALNNVGAGCVQRTRAAVMIGTSAALRVLWTQGSERVRVPYGLWRYRLDRRRIIVGGALSNGGNVREWLLRMLAGREEDPQVHRAEQDDLQRQADGLEPDAHGLTILPFLAGTRSPDYLNDARGTIHGLTLATTKAHLLRAGMEAIAYRLGEVADHLRTVAPVRDLVAAGGGLERSAAWTQIIADVLGRPVKLCSESELTSRGAAALALDQLGIARLDAIDPPPGHMVRPDTLCQRTYRAARDRQGALLRAILKVKPAAT